MLGLAVLDLAENELSTLPDEVFDGLELLLGLRLNGNRLQRLDRPFYRLTSLRILNLEQNQLTDLDEDVFISSPSSPYDSASLKRSLLELRVGGNQLTTLPDGLFNGFTKLRNLQLQSNQLARLPQHLFQTLGEVHSANLSSLKLLNLSQNALEDLLPDLFQGLNLSVIDLSHNNLRMLNATLFDLENLTTLDLRGNRLTDATRRDLARLKVELRVD
eukprot:s1130_g2.t1